MVPRDLFMIGLSNRLIPALKQMVSFERFLVCFILLPIFVVLVKFLTTSKKYCNCRVGAR